jgi:hypothetical protein
LRPLSRESARRRSTLWSEAMAPRPVRPHSSGIAPGGGKSFGSRAITRSPTAWRAVRHVCNRGEAAGAAIAFLKSNRAGRFGPGDAPGDQAHLRGAAVVAGGVQARNRRIITKRVCMFAPRAPKAALPLLAEAVGESCDARTPVLVVVGVAVGRGRPGVTRWRRSSAGGA